MTTPGELPISDAVRFSSLVLPRGQRQQHYLLSQPSKDAFSLPPKTWTQLGKALITTGVDSTSALTAWNETVAGVELSEKMRERLLLPVDAKFGPSLAALFANCVEMRRASSELCSASTIQFAKLAKRLFVTRRGEDVLWRGRSVERS